MSALSLRQVVQVVLERHVDVSAELHVLKHTLELGGEASAALCFQLGQHRLLAVD